ncbi:MAG: hypothetical protein ACM3NI_11665 [Bacteroidota bacterium]
MTPDPERDRLLALMKEYVALVGNLPHAQSLEELTGLLAQLDDLEDSIDALAEEPEARLH